jgi:hypothetical protein
LAKQLSLSTPSLPQNNANVLFKVSLPSVTQQRPVTTAGQKKIEIIKSTTPWKIYDKHAISKLQQPNEYYN